MSPRIGSRYPSRRMAAPTSFEVWKETPENATVETRAIWNYLTTPALGDPREMLVEEEQRVLSKGAIGGGFLVPTDLAEQILSAARAQSAIASLALELQTSAGTAMGLPTAATHGTAAWRAESGSYTLSRRLRA
jgi:HK97 family phage major capsid protein